MVMVFVQPTYLHYVWRVVSARDPLTSNHTTSCCHFLSHTHPPPRSTTAQLNPMCSCSLHGRGHRAVLYCSNLA